MTYESTSGLNVLNHYGPRSIQDGVAGGGELHNVGSIQQKVVYVTGDDFNGGVTFDTRLTLPAGALFIDALFDVEEAFVLGNADNVFNIGTDGTESTNGVAVANPDVTGVTQDATGAGTWAAALAADTPVSVSVTGTTAAVTAGSGKLKAVIRYQKI